MAEAGAVGTRATFTPSPSQAQTTSWSAAVRNLVTKDKKSGSPRETLHNSPIKFTVERHMKTCKTIKAASMEVDEAALGELKQSLARLVPILDPPKVRTWGVHRGDEGVRV